MLMKCLKHVGSGLNRFAVYTSRNRLQQLLSVLKITSIEKGRAFTRQFIRLVCFGFVIGDYNVFGYIQPRLGMPTGLVGFIVFLPTDCLIMIQPIS